MFAAEQQFSVGLRSRGLATALASAHPIGRHLGHGNGTPPSPMIPVVLEIYGKTTRGACLTLRSAGCLAPPGIVAHTRTPYVGLCRRCPVPNGRLAGAPEYHGTGACTYAEAAYICISIIMNYIRTRIYASSEPARTGW